MSEEKLGFNEYQNEALRTASLLPSWNYEKAAKEQLFESVGLSVLALGVAGEAGEVADYLKKVIGHGHALERDKLLKELGDVLWYVAVLANRTGISLEDVARENILKLRKRYPDGFDPERSKNRPEGS